MRKGPPHEREGGVYLYADLREDEMNLYHPVWQELVGVGLATVGVIVWGIGMVMILMYGGKGTWTL